MHHEKKDDASSEVEDSGEESDAEEYAEGPGWGELECSNLRARVCFFFLSFIAS